MPPTALVTRVRTLTGASSTDFSDTQVQEFLDINSTDYIRETMTPASSNGLTFDKFGASVGNWEATPVFRDASNAVVTAGLTFEPLTGILTANPALATSTLTITGRAYDVYGSCAELLEAWANKLSQEFDVSVDGNTYNRSQKAESLRTAAASFRRRARTRVGTTERGDEQWA